MMSRQELNGAVRGEGKASAEETQEVWELQYEVGISNGNWQHGQPLILVRQDQALSEFKLDIMMC